MIWLRWTKVLVFSFITIYTNTQQNSKNTLQVGKHLKWQVSETINLLRLTTIFSGLLVNKTPHKRASRLDDRGSIPNRGKWFILHPLYSDQLWSPLSLLSITGTGGPFLGGQKCGRGVTLTKQPHLVPKWRMKRYIYSYPWCLHGANGQLYLTFFVEKAFHLALGRSTNEPRIRLQSHHGQHALHRLLRHVWWGMLCTKSQPAVTLKRCRIAGITAKCRTSLHTSLQYFS
jgi:hypothetical protein